MLYIDGYDTEAAVQNYLSDMTCFDSLNKKLIDYPELKQVLSSILFEGKNYPYVATNDIIDIAAMFGFVYNNHKVVKVSNRIFETVL